MAAFSPQDANGAGEGPADALDGGRERRAGKRSDQAATRLQERLGSILVAISAPPPCSRINASAIKNPVGRKE